MFSRRLFSCCFCAASTGFYLDLLGLGEERSLTFPLDLTDLHLTFTPAGQKKPEEPWELERRGQLGG